MSPTAFYDRSNSKNASSNASTISQRTVSPKENLLSTDYSCSRSSANVDRSISEAKPQVLPAIIQLSDQQQLPGSVVANESAVEYVAGRPPAPQGTVTDSAPTGVRFTNNPHGTPLTPIAEQSSYVTLQPGKSKADEEQGHAPLRNQIPASLDESALREFQSIFRRSEVNDQQAFSCKSSNRLGTSDFARPTSPVDALPGQPPLTGVSPRPSRPSCPEQIQKSSSKYLFRSFRDCFRINHPPAFQDEDAQPPSERNPCPSHKFHTSKSEHSSHQDIDFTPVPGTRELTPDDARQRFESIDTLLDDGVINASTAVTEQPVLAGLAAGNADRRITNLRPATFPENRDDVASKSLDIDLPIYRETAPSPRHVCTSRESSISTIRAVTADQEPLQIPCPKNGAQPLSIHLEACNKPLPKNSIRPQNGTQVNFEVESSQSSSPAAPNIEDTQTTHTFRSAALQALLPIAAAQGIVRPYTITRRPVPQPRPLPPLPKRVDHKVHSCPHRAQLRATYRFRTNDDSLVAIELLHGGRGTGTEIPSDKRFERMLRTREDYCWKCRSERKAANVLETIFSACCPLSERDEQPSESTPPVRVMQVEMTIAQ